MTETSFLPADGGDRPIRTFHPRRGRMSGRHTDAMASLWPAYGLTVVDGDRSPLDLGTLFGRDAPRVLEIGFGMGDTTAAMAAADPGRDYLVVEVHTPGIGNLLALIGEFGLTNVRVAHGDAMQLVHRLAPGSLDAIHVFFPDPWPKARHHKRRLIQPANVALLRERLRAGGLLHCATDWPDYARSMAETLAADPGLRNDQDDAATRPEHNPNQRDARGDTPARPEDNPNQRDTHSDTPGNITARPEHNPDQRDTANPPEHNPDQRKTHGNTPARPEHNPDLRDTPARPKHNPNLRDAQGDTPAQPGHDPSPRDPHAENPARAGHRPVTKFERRGADAGRPIVDLLFRKQGGHSYL